MGFYYEFSAPGVGVSHFLCARGGGGRRNSPFQKIPGGFPGSGLELTDTLVYVNTHVHTPEYFLYLIHNSL